MGALYEVARKATAFEETDKKYSNTLRVLACASLAQPNCFYLIDPVLRPEMLTIASAEYEVFAKILTECQTQYRKHGKYTARGIALSGELGGVDGSLLNFAMEGADEDVRYAFDMFFEAWGQVVEVDLSMKVRHWVTEGLTSEEIVVKSEKHRREMGLSKLDSANDGKLEFEAKLLAAYEGKVIDYPVKPYLSSLRKLIPYYEPGDYVVAAALSGVGKSYNAINQLHFCAHSGIPCTYINLENTPSNVQKRFWQIETGYKFVDNMSQKTEDEISAGLSAWERVKKMPVFSVNPGRSLQSVISVIRQEYYERGTQFIVIDYAQLMNIPTYKGGGRNYELGEISAVLRLLALELKVVIMALVQFKQEVSRAGDRRGGLYDIKDCANFAQDATFMQALHRPEYFQIKEDADGNVYPENYADIFVCKGRETGIALAECRFDPIKGFYDVPQIDLDIEALPPFPSYQIPVMGNRTEDILF